MLHHYSGQMLQILIRFQTIRFRRLNDTINNSTSLCPRYQVNDMPVGSSNAERAYGPSARCLYMRIMCYLSNADNRGRNRYISFQRTVQYWFSQGKLGQYWPRLCFCNLPYFSPICVKPRGVSDSPRPVCHICFRRNRYGLFTVYANPSLKIGSGSAFRGTGQFHRGCPTYSRS